MPIRALGNGEPVGGFSWSNDLPDEVQQVVPTGLGVVREAGVTINRPPLN